jgi:hypothetical protein
MNLMEIKREQKKAMAKAESLVTAAERRGTSVR